MIQNLLLSLLMLVAATAVSAEGLERTGVDRKVMHYGWRPVSLDMSPQDYRQACQTNRRFLRDFLSTQANSALVSMSVPETGVRVLGAFAALAVSRDARVPLNRSRTLVLEFTDVADDHRAWQLGFRREW